MATQTETPTSTEAISTAATANLATSKTVNVGTRKSILARAQTDIVVDALKKSSPSHEFVIHAISTMGDKNQITALHDFNAKALWTFELEDMLLKGEVDFIVHSLKDIPTQIPAWSELGAVLSREDPRDALVLHPSLPPTTSLSSLPTNATIGTSSVRRSAQLKRLYPHLQFRSVRGNVQTRLRKLDESDLSKTSQVQGSKIGDEKTVDEEVEGGEQPHYSALILAAAGLIRVGLRDRISKYLSSKNLEETSDENGKVTQRKGVLHAVGQGAIGVQTRQGDRRILDMLKAVHSDETGYRCLAERSLMRTLEGGCSVPIGVETEWSEEAGKKDMMTMRAIVVSVDGTKSVEAETEAPVRNEEMADTFGRDVARQLVEQGADAILQGIGVDRKVLEKQDGA